MKHRQVVSTQRYITKPTSTTIEIEKLPNKQSVVVVDGIAGDVTDLRDVPAVSQKELVRMRMQPVDCLTDVDDVDGAVEPQKVILAEITVHQMTRPVHRLHVLKMLHVMRYCSSAFGISHSYFCCAISMTIIAMCSTNA